MKTTKNPFIIELTSNEIKNIAGGTWPKISNKQKIILPIIMTISIAYEIGINNGTFKARWFFENLKYATVIVLAKCLCGGNTKTDLFFEKLCYKFISPIADRVFDNTVDPKLATNQTKTD